MSLLIRTALRHRSGSLACLLRNPIRSISIHNIKFSEENRKRSDTASAVTRSAATNNADVSTDVRPIGERIKENTKTASYLGVIVLGLTVTGVLFFVIVRELFSTSSPNSVYSAALDTCINDPRVQDALGSPIKGYGEESRRRRRQHVASLVVDRQGQPYIQMHFYIQGIRNKATVQLEKRMSDGRYRYLIVQLDHYPHTTIIIEDNRSILDGFADSVPPSPPLDEHKF